MKGITILFSMDFLCLAATSSLGAERRPSIQRLPSSAAIIELSESCAEGLRAIHGHSAVTPTGGSDELSCL